MEKMICFLIIIAVLVSIGYKVYRFFVHNEIITCYGEHFQWTDEKKESAAGKNESQNIN